MNKKGKITKIIAIILFYCCSELSSVQFKHNIIIRIKNNSLAISRRYMKLKWKGLDIMITRIFIALTPAQATICKNG